MLNLLPEAVVEVRTGQPEEAAVLAAVEDWWIDGDFKADRIACLARLDKEVAARG